ncbi:uncharacterized protein LOC131012057 [Salvia miltiorrhiza]|uniref:uncharacterized protein LOC131012057 n=1 Tax=Salvia miltiorrhiza TaxID=226208 RepID=UPI0025ABCD71|nr:uncharacterized protein LOC131012057 [Salvia miltiorrhiza]
MNNPWEGYLSGTYIPDTEEDFSNWGSPPKVYFPFSATFSEEEGESDMVEEIEAVCSPVKTLALPKSRWSLFRRPAPLKYYQMLSSLTVETLISYPDDVSLVCEENWDDVVRYCGPEAPVRKPAYSPAMLVFLNGLLPFPEYWQSIVASPSDGKRRT